MNILNNLKKMKNSSNASYSALAIYILNNINNIEQLSIQQLANRAKTSSSTVTRFCKAIGLDGFKSLVPSVVTEFKFLNEIEKNNSKFIDNSDFDLLLISHKENVFNSINESFNSNLRLIPRVAELIGQANKVFFFGVGGNAYLLIHLENLLARIGIQTVFSFDIDQQQAFASNTKDNDLCIILDYSLHKRQIENILNIINKTKCKKVVLTKNLIDDQIKNFDVVLNLARNESVFQGRRMNDITSLFFLEQIGNCLLKYFNKFNDYKNQDRE